MIVNTDFVIDVKMKHLNSIVIPKVAAYWRTVADYLDYEPSMIQVIDQRYRDPILCCQDLFRDWLRTDRGLGPKTWTTLLDALKQIRQLIAIAEEIEANLAELKLYVIYITLTVWYTVYLL